MDTNSHECFIRVHSRAFDALPVGTRCGTLSVSEGRDWINHIWRATHSWSIPAWVTMRDSMQLSIRSAAGIALAFSAFALAQSAHFKPELYSGMRYRLIGPYRGR